MQMSLGTAFHPDNKIKIIDDSCLKGIPGNAFRLDNTTHASYINSGLPDAHGWIKI